MASKLSRDIASEAMDIESNTQSVKRASTPTLNNKKKIVVPVENEVIEEEYIEPSSDENDNEIEDQAQDDGEEENEEEDEEQQEDESELIKQQQELQAKISAFKKKKQQQKRSTAKKTIHKQNLNNLGQAVKRNIRGIAKKVEKTEAVLFKELGKKVNKVGGDKVVTMMSDLVEGIEYPIDSIKCFIARNERACVTVEFSSERILYL